MNKHNKAIVIQKDYACHLQRNPSFRYQNDNLKKTPSGLLFTSLLSGAVIIITFLILVFIQSVYFNNYVNQQKYYKIFRQNHIKIHNDLLLNSKEFSKDIKVLKNQQSSLYIPIEHRIKNQDFCRSVNAQNQILTQQIYPDGVNQKFTQLSKMTWSKKLTTNINKEHTYNSNHKYRKFKNLKK